MKTFKIFTAGKMDDLTYHEQMCWRLEIETTIREHTDRMVTFIHPPQYFDYNSPNQKLAKQWGINQIIDSDIVVIDLSTIKDSISTHIELGIIEAINNIHSKHIYVVGIGKPNVEHPWIDSSIFKQVDTIEEAAEFITNYLLI